MLLKPFVEPVATKPLVVVPTPVDTYLGVLTSPTSVQAVPLYCSFLAGKVGLPLNPETDKVAVLIPNPVLPCTAVFKAPPVDHAPTGRPAFHSSVAVVGPPSNPPDDKASALLAPALAMLYLAVFKSPSSVQEVPL